MRQCLLMETMSTSTLFKKTALKHIELAPGGQTSLSVVSQKEIKRKLMWCGDKVVGLGLGRPWG